MSNTINTDTINTDTINTNTINTDNKEYVGTDEYPNGMDTNVDYLKKNKDYIVNRYINYAFEHIFYDFDINSEYKDEFAEHIYQGIIKLFESEIWDIVEYTLFRLSNTVVNDWDYIDELCLFMENELFNYDTIFSKYIKLKQKYEKTKEYSELYKKDLFNNIIKNILDRICIQEFMMNIT